MSTTEGEVQGIGMDTGNTYGGSSTLYQIYGTGTLGTQVTNVNGVYNTPGIWQTYTINLGVLPTNETHLFFYINDAVSGSGFAGADEQFRNLSVYTQGATPAYINFDQYFALDGKGASLWLVKTDGSGNPLVFEDHASYGAAGPGEAQGLWPNGSGGFYPMSSVTSGAANSGPYVPSASVQSIGSITYSGTTATATTATADGLLVGEQIAIAGATPSQYDGTFLITATTGANTFTYTMAGTPASNASGTMTAAPAPLVISEVMYDPPDLANGLGGQPLEYIKITNIGTTAVTLTNWRLRTAVSFNFPSGQTLAAGASLLVVPFDPVNNPDALARFEARYPGYASSGLVMDGPYSGA